MMKAVTPSSFMKLTSRIIAQTQRRRASTFSPKKYSFVDETGHAKVKEKVFADPNTYPALLYLGTVTSFAVGMALYNPVEDVDPLLGPDDEVYYPEQGFDAIGWGSHY
eukprot:CAMPEP_0116031624 /NCGR_PEP_ID=MMETSP0321-20121206/17669_1 /TAXON_ID=163516 /ORGANISM="Leptocylindrus danicus var. danicus, Strain B650" /LENGTH=107 /DNA_ID=CAMNT_0003506873 /DNA_START=42 /DNA_END=365 /DNA_ORIENTATION=+